jgi:hypothetical protein
MATSVKAEAGGMAFTHVIGAEIFVLRLGFVSCQRRAGESACPTLR